MPKKTHLFHPGTILKVEFLDEIGMKPGTLARAIGVDRARNKAIIDGKRDITADTALRLARFLGTTPELWLNLQKTYDLSIAAAASRGLLAKIRPWQAEETLA